MKARLTLWLAAALLSAGMVHGVSVTIHQKMRLGDGEISHLLTTFASTEETFTSLKPHEVDGWQFVGWEITPVALAPNARYPWGQCVERVRFVPKDAVVTLVAHYERTDTDSDRDGIPDATEMFWFGTLEHDGDSDVDGDGLTFAEELALGTQPGLANGLECGGIAVRRSGEIVHNRWLELGWTTYGRVVQVTFRSEPEGVLFPTRTQLLAKSGSLEPFIPALDPPRVMVSEDSPFAYWTINGERVEDAFGTAVLRIAHVPDDLPRSNIDRSEIMECVAHCVDNVPDRFQAYYGPNCTGDDSDDDNDGRTAREELAEGTHPLLKNEIVVGGITRVVLGEAVYDPKGQAASYTLRSEPEGALFATQRGEKRLPGETVQTPPCTPRGSTFAYWTVNGVRQADDWGVALDALTVTLAPGENEIIAHTAENAFERFSLYWFGDTSRPATDDSDNDGIPLAEEIALHLNPLLPNTFKKGGITVAEGDLGEVNLQGFDQQTSILVGEDLFALFATTDPATGTFAGGHNFGSPVTPLAIDLSGDGLYDLLIATAESLCLYVNTGTEGNPAFTSQTDAYPLLQARLATMAHRVLCGGDTADGPKIWACDDGGAILEYDVATDALRETGLTGFPLWSAETGLVTLRQDGSCVDLATGFILPLDVPATDITSAALAEATGDGQADLLVADASGRIALYARTADGFTLEHRVWGGSFEDFAEGLTLAPVDWEADGDLDMLCGTAAGKLLLLSDPNVGRPSNLRATAGYDNVSLEWDPNGQSRVYGYGVYRAQAADFARIAEPSLPTYRDTPPSLATWAYRVTALSRLWTAGNSEPETFESLPSETAEATLGAVTLTLPDGAGFLGQPFEATLAIDNSDGLAQEGFAVTLAYDPAQVDPLGVEPTALAAGLTITQSVDAEAGSWTISATGGAPAPGTGGLLRLRLKATAKEPCDATLTVASATFGENVRVRLPEPATFALTWQPDPAAVTLSAQDATLGADGRATVTVEVAADERLDWATLEIAPTFDKAALTLVSATPATQAKPQATFVLAVTEAGREAREAEIAFAGTAQGTDGTPALVSRARCRVLIPDEEDEAGDAEQGNRPGWRPLVALSAPNREAEEGKTVTIPVIVTELGFLDWRTLAIAPVYDTSALTLTDSHVQVSELYREVWFTFRVEAAPETGWHRDVTVRFEGTGRGHNGAEAIVRPAECVIRVKGRPHPDVVRPWTNGDCDGDGRLTWNDYQVAFRTVQRCHPNGGNRRPTHTEADRRVHRALCQAIGKPADADLRLADVTNTYKKWLWARGVTDTNMGNGKGGRK